MVRQARIASSTVRPILQQHWSSGEGVGSAVSLLRGVMAGLIVWWQLLRAAAANAESWNPGNSESQATAKEKGRHGGKVPYADLNLKATYCGNS
jgi:hypothetical protein